MVPLESEEDALPALSSLETPESLLLRRSDWQLVQDALGDLPLVYREALLLCDVEELAYKEIAAVIGIPIGTVMSRIARARQALRSAVMKRQKGVANAL
jgi:RNA polymerase sigma-70 factor (ECF subfamily)